MNELLLSLLNIHGLKNVRQTEVYSPEPFVPESSPSEDEITIGRLILIKFWQN